MVLQPVLLSIPQSALPRTAEQVQQQRTCARSALQKSATRCGAPANGWVKNDRNAPLPNEGFHWSVSHKRRWAAAVVSDQPVGIDIESVRPRPRPLHDFLADDEEWSILGDRSWDAFFRLWTAKEAALKANGVGIGKLQDCRLTAVLSDKILTLDFADRSWPIEHFHHDGHIAAVTCTSAGVDWCVMTDIA